MRTVYEENFSSERDYSFVLHGTDLGYSDVVHLSDESYIQLSVWDYAGDWAALAVSPVFERISPEQDFNLSFSFKVEDPT